MEKCHICLFVEVGYPIYSSYQSCEILWVYYSYHGWNNGESGRLNNLPKNPGQQATWQRHSHRSSHEDSHYGFQSGWKCWKVWQHQWLLSSLQHFVNSWSQWLVIFASAFLSQAVLTHESHEQQHKRRTTLFLSCWLPFINVSKDPFSLLHSHGHSSKCLRCRSKEVQNCTLFLYTRERWGTISTSSTSI